MQTAKYESAVQSAKVLKRKTLSGTVYQKCEYDLTIISYFCDVTMMLLRSQSISCCSATA